MRYEPTLNSNKIKILSLCPNKNGISFSYFESPRDLIDWGNLHCTSANINQKLRVLIDHFSPQTVLTEDNKGNGFKRGQRANAKLESIYSLTAEENIYLKKYSAAMVKGVFDCFEAHNKYERAKLLSAWYPGLISKLPPKPKPWSSPHHNFPIFDSAAFALAYFYTEAI